MLSQEIKKSSGFILVNKPSGPTSHDIINQMRRITGIKKIGHAGTLDPFASGLLIVAIGREATREIDKFVKMDKEYIATLYLGAVSDTHDREGKILDFRFKILDLDTIKNTLVKFIGEQKQVPPMFSAKKVKGKKLYELARQGIEIEREPVDINIYSIDFLEYEWPLLKIKVRSSSGTYIRSLAYDIGEKLGCGAYLEELERTAIGEFRIENAITAEGVNNENWQNYLFL